MGVNFPEAFIFLLTLPPLLYVYWKGGKRSRDIIRVFKYRSLGVWYTRLRLLLISILIGSLVVIGAKPYIESREQGTFLFLVDVSRSMNARYSCAEPTFLERAKNVMLEITSEIPEAKFGIFAFDRLTFPITQITYDRNYLEQVIEYGLHVGLTYEATATDIENALSVVANKKNRLPQFYHDVSYVVLISDGYLEGNYQARLNASLEALVNSDIKIVSMGIGNIGETPVPIVTDTGECRSNFHTTIDGKQIMVPLREDILTLISAGTQGEYFGESQVDALVQYLRINGLTEIEANVEVGENQHRDISWFFLILATFSLLGIMSPKIFQLIERRYR